MLQPKKQKYRKSFRGRMKGKSSKGVSLDFGEFGLKAIGRGWLTAQQIEAARKAITHYTKRQAKVWIRIFPDKPVTAKAAGAGMGGGKGDIDKYVFVVTPGRILFEISGVEEEIAKEAMRLANHKLPFRTRFISKG
ncbi:50S ribosomal protein L16 [Candidatus Microgenomates bacterium]|nr:50S ribosomal protein L16 [Candidatus Microgenomates bacterium]